IRLIFRTNQSISSSVSASSTPNNTRIPLSISPTISSAIFTFDFFTRCNTTRIFTLYIRLFYTYRRLLLLIAHNYYIATKTKYLLLVHLLLHIVALLHVSSYEIYNVVSCLRTLENNILFLLISFLPLQILDFS